MKEGLIISTSDNNESFFHYGYKREKSKLLYSAQRRHISNFSSGILFNKHKSVIANGELEEDFSNLFFFLLSVMGRSQDVNKYLNNVSTRAVDITQADFKP